MVPVEGQLPAVSEPLSRSESFGISFGNQNQLQDFQVRKNPGLTQPLG